MLVRSAAICALFLFVASSVEAGNVFVDGATGNDANPGTAAAPLETIQAGIDAAAASPGADTVHVAAGNYVETLSIADPNRLTIDGGGATVTPADAGDDVIEIGTGNVTVRDLNVSGGDKGFDVDDATELNLVDVDVSGTDDDCVNAKNVTRLNVLRGSYTSDGDHGLSIEGIGAASLQDVTADNNGDRGVNAEDVGNMVVDGGSFSWNTRDGIKLEIGGKLHGFAAFGTAARRVFGVVLANGLVGLPPGLPDGARMR